MDTVNVQQQGDNRLSSNLYVIVPRSNFSCNGRITRYMASLFQNDNEFDECNFPRILVWRPSNTEQTIYTIQNTYTLQRNDIDNMRNYYLADVSFTNNDRIEFQSGDVIGYQHRSSPCYTAWSINTPGYTSYTRSTNFFFNTINIGSSFITANTNRQPLIQVTFGMYVTSLQLSYVWFIYFTDIRCDDLVVPANGAILSCSSGTDGVGYEGDTCSFTCNTGYELIGIRNETIGRICQSDGSWSDRDVVCRRGMYTYGYTVCM